MTDIHAARVAMDASPIPATTDPDPGPGDPWGTPSGGNGGDSNLISCNQSGPSRSTEAYVERAGGIGQAVPTPEGGPKLTTPGGVDCSTLGANEGSLTAGHGRSFGFVHALFLWARTAAPRPDSPAQA